LAVAGSFEARLIKDWVDKTTTAFGPHGAAAKGLFAIIPFAFLFVLALLLEELFRRTLGATTLDQAGVEFDGVLAIERLALTGNLYTDPHAPPFVLLLYGPLQHYVATTIHRALQLDTSVASFYFAGRLTALLSLVALMIGVGVILVRFLHVKLLVATIASLLVGLSLYPWAYVVRPDSMYCALGIWSLAAFHSFLASRSVPRLLTSTALLVCAFYAKQTAIMFLPLLGIAGLLYLQTNVQRLTFLLGAAAIAGIGAILAPPHYWQNATVSVASGVDLVWALKFPYKLLLGIHGIPLTAWLTCLLLLLFDRKRWWLIPTGVVSVYALGVGAALSLKWGSSVNYFNEFLIANIMLVAASLPAIASAWIGPRIVALGFSSTLLLSYIAILGYAQVGPYLFRSPDPQINDPALLALQRYFADRPSSGLVADLALNPFVVFLPTRVAFATFDVTGPAAATGRLDLVEVQRAIRSGLICYAVSYRAWATDTGQDHEKRSSFRNAPWAPPILRLLLPQFEPLGEYGDLVLLHNPVCPAS
jgi:hypothetical protein